MSRVRLSWSPKCSGKLFLCTVRDYSRKIVMLFRCLILEFISLSQSEDFLIVKAVKASINVSNVSYKSCTLLCSAEKEKCLHKISVYFYKTFFSPGLRNIGAQIRCAQNRQTAVQTDVKYPLTVLLLCLNRVLLFCVSKIAFGRKCTLWTIQSLWKILFVNKQPVKINVVVLCKCRKED